MKDEHAYGKKMARKGCTKVIYKWTFISKRSLCIIVNIDKCIRTLWTIKDVLGNLYRFIVSGDIYPFIAQTRLKINTAILKLPMVKRLKVKKIFSKIVKKSLKKLHGVLIYTCKMIQPGIFFQVQT